MILKVAMPGKMQFKIIRREPAFFMAKEGDIHFTVNTRQVNENDINKMMERANFERRKRNIAIGRK